MRGKHTMGATLFALWLGVFWGPIVSADLVCDGQDDDLLSGLSASTFLSASTGTMMTWFRPSGTAGSHDSSDCWGGEHLLTMVDDGSVPGLGLFRNGNLLGDDRLCAWNYDGTSVYVPAVYTVNVWTHLALVHGGGTLTFYKDGVLVGSAPAGDTFDVTNKTLHLCAGTLMGFPGTGQGTFVGVEVFPTAVSEQEINAKAKARLHHLGVSARSGAWRLDSCATTGNGVTFFDISGNARPLTGDDGPNNSGLTCQPNTVLTYGWGAD